MNKALKPAIFAATLLLVCATALIAGDRLLLWRVVQTCVANHQLTGASFPCLAVDVKDGVERGTAVLRAPLQNTHLVVVPTARVTGIEESSLQTPQAPNYLAAAWDARRFVADGAPRPLDRSDFGLAINSLPGRSQDQLHIHVDCVFSDVKRLLQAHQGEIGAKTWTRLAPAFHGQHYMARRLTGASLDGVNVFKLLTDGLDVDPSDLSTVTIVVIGATFEDDKPGFYLLADHRIPGRHNLAHGEFLLDHSCAAR